MQLTEKLSTVALGILVSACFAVLAVGYMVEAFWRTAIRGESAEGQMR